MTFGSFNAADENGPSKAETFIREYLQEYREIALTDFDERIPRLEETYPINQIIKGVLFLW
jgi:hypothetical protein